MTKPRLGPRAITPERANALRASLPEVITRTHAAQLAGVTTRTVDRWCRATTGDRLKTHHGGDDAAPRRRVMIDTADLLSKLTVVPSVQS